MNIIQAILAGDHDDDLTEIAAAVDQRERALSPGDAIQMLARIYDGIAQFATAPAQQRAQAGSELNQVLKQLSDDPNPHVQALISTARVDVLVKMLGVPRTTAVSATRTFAEAEADDGDAPDCSQCGASNAGSRTPPHLCPTCATLPQSTT